MCVCAVVPCATQKCQTVHWQINPIHSFLSNSISERFQYSNCLGNNWKTCDKSNFPWHGQKMRMKEEKKMLNENMKNNVKLNCSDLFAHFPLSFQCNAQHFSATSSAVRIDRFFSSLPVAFVAEQIKLDCCLNLKDNNHIVHSKDIATLVSIPFLSNN